MRPAQRAVGAGIAGASSRRGRGEGPVLEASTRATAAIGLGTFVLVLVAFAPLLGGGFQADDFPHVDRVLRRGPFAVWSGGEAFFRPLVSVSFWLDAMIWGVDARGFHASNLLVHGLTSVGVGWLAMRLARQDGAAGRRLWLATAALFAVLPSHSEPVGWISARVDLWAALGAVTSLILFMRHREGGGRSLLVGSLVALGLGLLAKESIVLLPVLVLVIELAHFGTAPVPALVRAAPFAGVVAVYAGVRAAMIGDPVGGYGAGVHLDPATVAWTLRTYPVRVWLPPLPGDRYHDVSRVIFVVSGVWLVWALRRDPSATLRWVIASTVAFVAAAAPVLPLWVFRETSAGERLLYWPSAVACVALATAVARFTLRRSFAIAALVAVGLGAVSSYRGAVSWAEAGRETERQARAIAALPQEGRTLVGPLLDSRRGVFMFLNAFESAMRLYSDEERRSMPLAPIRFRQDDPQSTMRVALAEGGAVIEVGADAGVLMIVDRLAGGVRVREHEPTSVIVELPEAGEADTVVIVRGDRLFRCRPGVDCPSGVVLD